MSETTISLTMTAAPTALVVIRHVLDGLHGHWPLRVGQLDDIQIAVGEACAGVVQHAQERQDDGALDLHVALADEDVVVTVRDRGRGPRAAWDSMGQGMGMAMIGALADELSVQTTRASGHEVRMTFRTGASA